MTSRSPRLISSLPKHVTLTVQRYSEHEPGAGCQLVGTSVVHDHAVIALCLEGQGHFWAGSRYHYEPGHVLLLPEAMPHYMQRQEGIEFIGLSLCMHCMRPPWDDTLRALFTRVQQGQPPVWPLSTRDAMLLAHTFERLEQALESVHTARSELLVDGLMSTLSADLWHALEEHAILPVRGASSIVAQALDYISAHATDAISLSDVAHAVGRHPSHLAARVKEESGRTVVEWITHGRMSRARQLLLSCQDNLEQIAEHVGFSSPSHFHRTFKRWHEMSPGKWRRLHRQ